MIKSHGKALFLKLRDKAFLVVLLVAILFAFGMQGTSSANTAVEIKKSSEIGFTSVSPRGSLGGEIIPASCESGVWDSTWDWAHPDGNNSGTCAPTTCQDPLASNNGGPLPCTYSPVNGVCGTSHNDCTVGRLAVSGLTCLENDNCAGTVLSCNYSAPDGSGTLANSLSKPVSFGSWSNSQCSTAGTGWHQGGISSCSTGQGSTNAKCTSVVVDPPGQPAETASSWTWSCVGNYGGSTASCTEAKPLGCAYSTDASGNALTIVNTSNPAISSGGVYKAAGFGNYCFGNSGGPTYFAPLNTLAEFLSFWNNIQAGQFLLGLYRVN